MTYDGHRGGQGGSAANSLVHQLEYNEVDEEVSNLSKPYEVSMHGQTYTTNANSPTALTTDSYHIMLAGGQQNYIKMLPQWWTTLINSDTLYVGQPQGPALTANASSVLFQVAQSTNTGSATWASHHMIRLMAWNTRNVADDGTSFTNITTNLGVGIDGTANTAPGQIQGHLEFTPAANPYGLSICSNGQSGATCSIQLDNYGNPNVIQQLNLTKGGWLNFADKYGNEGGWMQAKTGTDTTGATAVDEVDLAFPDAANSLFYVGGNETVSGNFAVGGKISLGSQASVSANGTQWNFAGPVATPFTSVSGTIQTLSQIEAATHYEGDEVWCHDCLNSGQTAGNGTGRKIWRDSAGTWRTGDGAVAAN